MEGNREVEEAVPYFEPGTMAVLCGPGGSRRGRGGT